MGDKVIPVKVALRVRPLNNKERDEACEECLRTVFGEQQVILGKNKAFTYDYVFCQKSPQVEIYETCVQSLLTSLFKGYNATVLAYGQTGSGKTHTMGSGTATLANATSSTNGFLGKDCDNVGVIPRVLNDLFLNIDELKSKDQTAKFQVKVSFVEVYNEEIKDLFGTGPQEPLNIREENNSIRVVNLSEAHVEDARSTITLLEKGTAMRMTGGTAMNNESSRSHAIFTITLEQTKNETDLIKSKFHLVDLAGSERQSKTKAEGIRLREGININLGLLALGNVISVLGEDNVKHVPYRESKLTRLLQDSLGGNSHTLMIACASPADSNMEETLNTLRYADRARKIKNKPIVNIDPQVAELNNLREQVQFLKAQILQLTGGCGLMPEFNPNNDTKAQKEEMEKLKAENVKLFGELQRLININRHTYDRMTQLESEKEEQKRKFDEIKLAFERISKDAEEQSCKDQSLNGTDSQNNTKSLISDIQNKLGEYEQLTEIKEDAQTEATNDDDNIEPSSSTQADKEFTLRQAAMQFQLTEYDTDLQRKQALHSKMLDNLTRSHMGSAANMDELKSRIDCLEREKEELQRQVHSSHSTPAHNDRKMGEQRRERLKMLETEVNDLRRKEKELQRMIKLKEENEKQCEKLKNEITQIKSDRVKLIKQMRSDNDSFRRYKTEKEREVTQLKAQERRRLVEISKLQGNSNRQEAVLKRKNEEIGRIQRQLRDTSAKQKIVAAQRQQTFDRKDGSQLGERLRSWITNELELSVGLAEARLNLAKLIEERKESSIELIQLTEKLDRYGQENDVPYKQRKLGNVELDSTYVASTADEEDSEERKKKRDELAKRIERTKEEIEMKNVQINELQAMVIEGDADDKAKHLFNSIHGLLEAKVVLKHLYSTGVQYLLDSRIKQESFENISNGFTQELKDLKKKLEITEDEVKQCKKDQSQEQSRLIHHYEQRILILLKSGIQNQDECSDERIRIMMETLKSMEKKVDSTSRRSANTNLRRSVKTEGLSLGAKDDFKRVQRVKRDHRRTRVIRTEDVEPLRNRANIQDDAIMEQSPSLGSPQSRMVPPTPDDKIKDPDWNNPWATTPLKAKTRVSTSFQTYLKKGPRRSKISRTRLLPVAQEAANLSSNNENE